METILTVTKTWRRQSRSSLGLLTGVLKAHFVRQRARSLLARV